MLLSDAEKIHRYKQIRDLLLQAASNYSTKNDWLFFCINCLSQLPHFQWTGIYEYNSQTEQLTLFPHYIGLPTEHIHIPKGKGVCGTAIARNSNMIIEDVTRVENYLACSMGTQSEIVVLLKDQDRILGQIDVDSDDIGAFNQVDQHELDVIANIIVDKLKHF